VKSFNEDLPFDQFTIWQLAGDLLPDATDEQKIASGFNRNHLLNGEGGAIAEEQRWVILFDRMETTSTTWLGLTMNCAQCHDHKYDPMTQRDYYSMLDAFNRVPESGTPQYFSSRVRVAAPFLEYPFPETKARIAEFDTQIAALEAEVTKGVDTVYEEWRAGLIVDGKLREGSELAEAMAALVIKPDGELNEDQMKTPRRSYATSDDHERFSTSRDKNSFARRVFESDRESLLCHAGLLAASTSRCSDQSSGICSMARVGRASADRASAGESHVAALLWRWIDQDGRRLWRAERVSNSRIAAGLAGGGIPRTWLEHEASASFDRDECDVSTVQSSHPGAQTT
jgi:hypothetical protein